VRDFFGALAIMVGLGFFGWGIIFLIRHPGYGEGKMAVVVGLSAILIGFFLMFPASHDSEWNDPNEFISPPHPRVFPLSIERRSHAPLSSNRFINPSCRSS
jgi:hypothetical protein